MKVLQKIIILSIIIISSFGCEKVETPAQQLVGSWKITGYTIVSEGKALDYWAMISTPYPCAKDLIFTFSNTTLSTPPNTSCNDKNGASLVSYFLPSSATYTVGVGNNLTITSLDSGFGDLTGPMAIIDGKLTWQVKKEDNGTILTGTITMQKQ